MKSSDQLKLTKVVLFKIGIGSFEKKGEIDLAKKKSKKLSVSKSVMNDLLKTFSVLKTKGDLTVSGVSYEAKDTNRSKLLQDNAINLPNSNSLISLIQQVRGIKLKILLNEETVNGWVIGTQEFEEAPTGQAIVSEDYIILKTESGAIRSVKIAQIEGLKILDPDVSKDFEYFLETIISQNKQKNKVITLFFEGSEESEYMINFLQEVPAWKTSYRLFLEENVISEDYDNDQKESEASFDTSGQIQGWAIVDNVLDEDWDGVDLTLVTGLPISFIYDSYSPAWINRPKIERKTDLGVKVVQFERTLEEAETMAAMEPAPRKMKRMAARRAPIPTRPPSGPPSGPLGGAGPPAGAVAGLTMNSLREAKMDDEVAESTFETGAEAEGGKGVAFKYHIGNPVHVRRNNSSLIPILQSELDARVLTVYNKKVNVQNPILTIEFENNTGLTLEEGPISVFIEGDFSGEALLPFLENGDTAKLPYSVDQSVEISHTLETKTESFHKITVSDNIYTYYYYTYIHEYRINNKGTTPRKLVIEHPRYHDRELYNTSEPTETTKNFLRYEMDIEPKKSGVFTIKERSIKETYRYLSKISKIEIEDWAKKGLLKENEKEYLMKRLELNTKRNELENKKEEINDRVSAIFSEQERLRENLKSFSGSKAEQKVVERYIEKFDRRETELEQMNEKRDEINSKLTAVKEEIQELDKKWKASQLSSENEEGA